MPTPSSLSIAASLAAMFLTSAAVVRGQTPVAATPGTTGSRWQGGAGIVGAVPVGDFATFVEEAGGVTGHLDRSIAGHIVRVGGEVTYLAYGDQTRTVSLASLVPEVPGATLKVNTSNAMLLAHARLRVQAPPSRWRWYADGLLGLTDMFTTSSIPGPTACVGLPAGGSACTTTEVAGATNSRDVVFSYGGGGGVAIKLRASSKWPRLDLSARYLRGGEARYLTEGGLRIEGSRAVLNFSQSRTDMVGVYIGFLFGA